MESSEIFYEWQRKFPEWNEFTISTYRSRYAELLNAYIQRYFYMIDS